MPHPLYALIIMTWLAGVAGLLVNSILFASGRAFCRAAVVLLAAVTVLGTGLIVLPPITIR
jgi:membrane-associated PAP2 superfamily phosphatase